MGRVLSALSERANAISYRRTRMEKERNEGVMHGALRYLLVKRRAATVLPTAAVAMTKRYAIYVLAEPLFTYPLHL